MKMRILIIVKFFQPLLPDIGLLSQFLHLLLEAWKSLPEKSTQPKPPKLCINVIHNPQYHKFTFQTFDGTFPSNRFSSLYLLLLEAYRFHVDLLRRFQVKHILKNFPENCWIKRFCKKSWIKLRSAKQKSITILYIFINPNWLIWF